MFLLLRFLFFFTEKKENIEEIVK